MSKGDINAFLKSLFQSEGGTNPKIVNQYGYIGKYQFGEDALIDLGYYKPDGTNNRTLTGKFKYDWVGEWTGKNGVKCRDDFLKSESIQDQAAREWVKLLCSRAKKFKLQQYIGQTIHNIQITESGIIAAAHLRGFGSSKSPGVRQFLTTNGDVDPKDANGTPVSKYMHLFADYELGCCGSVTAVLLDKDKNPITGLDYQIKVGNKVAAKGKTGANGATDKIQGLEAGTNITILVKKLEGSFKEIKSFIAHEETAFVATLRSATRMVTAQLERHLGTAGDYKRRSELAKQEKPTPSLPPKTSKPEPTPTPAPAPHAKPTLQKTEHAGQRTSTSADAENSTKPEGSNALTVFSSPQEKISSQERQAAVNDTNEGSATDNAGPEIETKVNSSSLDGIANESDAGGNEANDDGDGGAAPMPPDQPVIVEPKRNEDGHPVAVAKPSKERQTITPSVQLLEEILMRNVNTGKKGQSLSGPASAEKSKKGKAISLHEKKEDQSLGQCYKYVKIALLASGMTKRYLGQEAAKNAGPELKKEGYQNLLNNQNHGLRSPYDAPVGAIVVYDVTDGTPWGHIEVRVSGGFASDYFSERPRTSPRNEKKQDAVMAGRNRKVSGIWVKE